MNSANQVLWISLVVLSIAMIVLPADIIKVFGVEYSASVFFGSVLAGIAGYKLARK